MSRDRAAARDWVPLTLAPGLLLLNTTLGQVLPYRECSAGGIRWSVLSPVAGALLCLLAAGIAWGGRRRAAPGSVGPVVATAVSLIIALALTLQGVAGLVLTGCER